MLTSYQCICMCTPSFISKIVRRMRKMTNLFHDFCMEHHHWSQSWKVGITEEQDSVTPLLWRHNECDGASKHRRLHCLPNRLFRRKSKKTLKAPRNWLFVRGIHRWPVDSPHKVPVTRKMFPSRLPNWSPLLAPWIVVPTIPVVPATCQHSGSRALVAFYYHMD